MIMAWVLMETRNPQSSTTLVCTDPPKRCCWNIPGIEGAEGNLVDRQETSTSQFGAEKPLSDKGRTDLSSHCKTGLTGLGKDKGYGGLAMDSTSEQNIL